MPEKIFDYDVVDMIGEGAGSLIYAVAHPDTHQVYALKYVRRRQERDQRFFEQIDNEYTVGRLFSHPVLRRYFALHDNHTLFRKPTEAALVMELVDGEPLNSRMPVEPIHAIDCFIQVAQGLGALHALGLAHCDLKPNNILVNASGTVKLIDFGQTCKLGHVKERIQGTPDFIAPEQVRCQPVTVRTDVFNFGATMYWMLAGRPIPTLYNLRHQQNSFLLDEAIAPPQEINPSVPAVLSNLVMECVRTNPMRRPADMAEVIRRMETVRHGLASREVALAC